MKYVPQITCQQWFVIANCLPSACRRKTLQLRLWRARSLPCSSPDREPYANQPRPQTPLALSHSFIPCQSASYGRSSTNFSSLPLKVAQRQFCSALDVKITPRVSSNKTKGRRAAAKLPSIILCLDCTLLLFEWPLLLSGGSTRVRLPADGDV